MAAWKKNKSMKLMNRGLETIITMSYLLATESYRLTMIERMVGGMPTQVYDKIFEPTDAIDTFEKLCIEAIEKQFEFPERSEDNKIFDLRDAETEDE